MKLRFALFAALLALVPMAHAQRSGGGGRGSSSGLRQLCHLTTEVAHTGDTSEFNAFSCTIPANTLGLNSRIFVHYTFFGKVGNTTNCSSYIRYGTTNSASDTAIAQNPTQIGANNTGVVNANINERNASNAQYWDVQGFRTTGVWLQVAAGTTAYSTAANQYLNFQITDGASADTCAVEEVDVTLWP